MKRVTEAKHLPADSCLICGKSLNATGGSRLIEQHVRGTALINSQPGDEDSSKWMPLEDGSDNYVVVWGDEQFVTDEVLQRARDTYLAGKQPWFCQTCGHRACPECGQPLLRPVSSEAVDDEGNISYCAVLGIAPKCSNMDCTLYGKTIPLD